MVMISSFNPLHSEGSILQMFSAIDKLRCLLKVVQGLRVIILSCLIASGANASPGIDPADYLFVLVLSRGLPIIFCRGTPHRYPRNGPKLQLEPIRKAPLADLSK